MAKYDLSTVTCQATPEQIVGMMQRIESEDFFSEFCPALMPYLPYEHAKPFLDDGVTPEQWQEAVGDGDRDNDATLRDQFQYYAKWWKEKIEHERGISVWRAKYQFALRMFLAGMPEWETLLSMDDGWYTRDAYEMARELCGLEELA